MAFGKVLLGKKHGKTLSYYLQPLVGAGKSFILSSRPILIYSWGVVAFEKNFVIVGK